MVILNIIQFRFHRFGDSFKIVPTYLEKSESKNKTPASLVVDEVKLGNQRHNVRLFAGKKFYIPPVRLETLTHVLLVHVAFFYASKGGEFLVYLLSLEAEFRRIENNEISGPHSLHRTSFAVVRLNDAQFLPIF